MAKQVRNLVAAQVEIDVMSVDQRIVRLAGHLVRKSGLPEPETDYPIGPYRVDFAWPARRLAGELDSIEFHSTQPKFVADRRRWADLDALGDGCFASLGGT